MEKKGIGRPSTYAPTVKVLREREYACLTKGHLQPTQLGKEVDEFLMRVLPKLIEPEFTAEMEGQLDAIASGKQNWESYLLSWNQAYFAPALEAAYRSLGASPGKTNDNKTQPVVTDIQCPKCAQPMHKISCRSKKLQADHFLKCPAPECGTAMFWSDKHQTYELPYFKRQESPQSSANTALKPAVLPAKKPFNGTSLPEKRKDAPSRTTEHPCPVCGKPLELYKYTKDSQQKQMLRCSNIQARRQDDHKDVAFFASKGLFWSPKYGEINTKKSGSISSMIYKPPDLRA